MRLRPGRLGSARVVVLLGVGCAACGSGETGVNEAPVLVSTTVSVVTVDSIPMASSLSSTSAPVTPTSPTTIPSSTTAPPSTVARTAAQLLGDGIGVADFGMPEADAIAILAADHGVPIASSRPQNSATPWASGCAYFADSLYQFPSGLMVGVTDGVFSSWAFAGGTATNLATSLGIKWGDSIEAAKQAYGEQYVPADLLPLYSWGGNVRVVATVDDHGPVVLSTLETASPEIDWLGRVWLLSAGAGCVPAPLVAPVGPAPIGERYVVRLNECLCSYDVLAVDGTPTGMESNDQCIGRAACVLSVRSDSTGNWEQLWAVQRVDRENDENVWQVFDVFVPEQDTDVISLGYCESASSAQFENLYAARQTSDGRALWVLTLDESTVSFVEQAKDDDLTCHYGPGAHGPPVEFTTV